MLSFFDGLRMVTAEAVVWRMLLSVLCGGLIGLEREYKRRPAGFRTHILICMGASLTTMTGQFLCLNLHYYTDMTRLGAQVVAGIGFIGAGAIILTRGHRVKGLTTAAGLWAAGIIGLSLGAGFYEGGLVATALVLLTEMVLSKVEYRILAHVPEVTLYVEYNRKQFLEDAMQLFRRFGLKLQDIEITRAIGEDTYSACVIFTLRLSSKCNAEKLIERIWQVEGVVSVQEL